MNDKTSQTVVQASSPVGALVAALGLSLVVAGGGLLLYVGFFVYTVLNAPAEIPLVGYVMDHFKIGDSAFSGVLTLPVGADQVQTMNFDVKIAESVRLFMFFFVGIVVFSVLARICNVLISSGTMLLKFNRSLQDKV